jgi:hypothetical protein
MSEQPTNLSEQQIKCRLRRLNYCATNEVMPRAGRLACYCYGIELAEAENLAQLAEGLRLSRAIALMHLRKSPSTFDDLDADQQET